jgi:metal-responsive CopG/Arc/MetJ family transcriptional regulator
MKVAVSIPDDVFEETERLVRKLHKSRSEVYSLALSEYVARYAPEYVTEAFDRVCTEVGDVADDFVSLAAGRVLERTEW